MFHSAICNQTTDQIISCHIHYDVDIYMNIIILYIYVLVFRVPTPPRNGMSPQVAPPSILFASYWQHF